MPRTKRGSTVGTIGDLIDGRYSLTIYCYAAGCRHKRTLDLEALAARLGRDHSSLHAHLAPHFRCSACGGRKVGFSLGVPPEAIRGR